MKTFLFSSLLFAASLSSAAIAQPIAKIQTGSGFSPVPRTTTVILNDDGTVTREVTIGAQQGGAVSAKVIDVAQINAGIVSALLNDVATVESSELVAVNPEAPQCFDAPTTSISVLKDNVWVLIGRNTGCKDFVLKGGEARKALRLLQSLETLSREAQ